MIRLSSSGRSYGRDGTKTESLTHPRKKTKTNHRCHLKNRSRHAAECMRRNGLSGWRLPCHKGRTHWAPMRYKKAWRVSLFICRSHYILFRHPGVQISRNVSVNYEWTYRAVFPNHFSPQTHFGFEKQPRTLTSFSRQYWMYGWQAFIIKKLYLRTGYTHVKFTIYVVRSSSKVS